MRELLDHSADVDGFDWLVYEGIDDSRWISDQCSADQDGSDHCQHRDRLIQGDVQGI